MFYNSGVAGLVHHPGGCTRPAVFDDGGCFIGLP